MTDTCITNTSWSTQRYCPRQMHRVLKKCATLLMLLTLPNVIDFHNSLSTDLAVIKWQQNIPSYLKSVATVPYEILTSENSNNLKHIVIDISQGSVATRTDLDAVNDFPFPSTTEIHCISLCPILLLYFVTVLQFLFRSKRGFSWILDSLSSAHRLHDFTDFCQPNFTKFEHNTSIGVAMYPFRTKFWKFFRKESFCQKNAKMIFFQRLAT